MAIAPIQGVSTTLLTIPVTPIRAVAPAVRADVEVKTDKPSETPEALAAEARAKAVTQAVQTAAPRQTALGPLFADLGQALKSRGLPEPVRAAAAQLAAQAVPLGAKIDGAAIARAFLQSGLFLEHNLGARPGASPAGRDMKADLLVLKQTLAEWLGDSPRPSPARTAAAPPPPYRGGPTTAQPAARGALPADAQPAAVGHRLAEDAEGALARHELLQAASLPAAHSHEPDAQTLRWMFEVPFATPQGASVAQFEISRDDTGPAAQEGGGPTYRARFSIDLEPLGPLHAQAALAGDHLGVTLWAERADSVELLRRAQPELSQALARVALKSDVAVYPGAPPRPTPGAGRFVDQST